jgi:serine/threonine protein kinase
MSAGACVKKPNLCLVTEFVKQGSLKDILLNPTIKLPLEHKLKLLHSAALGIHYLHSLHPAIIHRDLKSSNLLVRARACSCVWVVACRADGGVGRRWTRTGT